MPGISPILYYLFLAIGLAINIFFCLALINTLLLVKEANRRLAPGLIWLLLIPGFSTFWNFFVAFKLSQSIKNELDSRDFEVEGRPTLISGLSYAIIGFIYLVLSLVILFNPQKSESDLAVGFNILGLLVIVTFVQYWMKVIWYKKVLQNDEAEIINQEEE
ncbi:hypothetical protein WG906_11780 [Pedobacter sp. P351]|uniref:hypothetical protein n=1 Tax=Pedobacter superstes TaxID=3133441 RepID=UPI0030B72631